MKIYSSVDDYILSPEKDFRPKLELIRQTIKKIVPEAEEVISYGMPAFRYYGMLAYYAAFKNHYSFFFGPAVTRAFAKDLIGYKTSKATIQIPADKPVPVQLLKSMTKYSARLNEKKVTLKLAAEKKKNKR